MRENCLFRVSSVTLLGLLLLPASACTHPKPGSSPSGGAGGSRAAGGSGAGGSDQGGDSGSGGTSDGGSGGTNSTGGMGGGEVIVPPLEGDGGTSINNDGGTPPPQKMSCGDSNYSDKYSPGYSISSEAQAQAKSVLASLTLAEKAAQMRGTPPGNDADIFRTPDNSAKGIKGWLFRDGPRGLNLDAENPTGKNGYSTAFPVAIARGAAFDMELEYRIGDAIGDETLASNHTMLLSPTVNILRHPAWGRAQEVYGEDSFLLGRLGTAFTAGLQQYVAACAKHYAANNIENGRSSVNSQMDEQTLHEVYGRHFEMIVKEGGVACVMSAYNPVNGVKSTQNKHLNVDLLKGEFGFKGLLLSDWWAMPQAGSNADMAKQFTTEAVNAGMDLELPQAQNYAQLEAVVSAGGLKESQINDAVTRILEQKFRFNVAKTAASLGLKRPTTTLSSLNSIENNEAHIALAREAAVKSMVLLKNDGNTLPIKRAAVKTVAVVGLSVPYTILGKAASVNFATDPRMGDLGSSRVLADPAKSSGPFAGIKAIAGSGINVISGADAATASKADFVVVVAGLTPQDEGEEYTGAGDRNNFALDGKRGGTQQNQLITQVAALKKPMVVVLEGGSVIDMPWLDMVPAVVMAWYPGMDGGRALGDLLFGDASFSGKLPLSWAQTGKFGPPDLPTFKAGNSTPMEYDLGYSWYDAKKTKPLFAFGHGLSYTTFQYGNLQVPCSDVTKNGVVNVTVDITNKGSVKSDEVAFLFVGYPATKARRHIKELRGFYRVSLDAGQTKRITLPVRVSDLKYYDMASKSWQIESGPVQVMVGPSSDNLPLKDTFTVK